jgi:hypothetical protein
MFAASLSCIKYESSLNYTAWFSRRTFTEGGLVSRLCAAVRVPPKL